MLIHDAALERLHVVLGVDRAGLVGADGKTHHGCFDALFLPQIPGFTVLCPASFAELRTMLRQALFELSGPVAIRYPRGGEGAFQGDTSAEPLVRLRTGRDASLLTYGVLVNEALAAAELLAAEGIEAEVLKLNRIAPLDFEMFRPFFDTAEAPDILLAAEDSFGAGCVGQRVAALLAEGGRAPKQLILKNLGRTFALEGTVAQLEHRFELDAAGIAAAVREAAGHGRG